MTSLVTGATGFIGAHIVRALLKRGDEVRCLIRKPNKNIEGLDVDLVEGDITDPPREAFKNIDTVYHCAADYRLWARDPRELFRVNVDGTRRVIEAAANTRRIVYTSSVSAIGLGSPANEETPMHDGDLVGPYKRSKYEAEQVARELARKGAPVVIVNPSTPVGELDIKPTPTGQIIVDFLNRRMPAYVETGMNVVDVRDVAAGHLLAADRGRIGERYILGNRNMTLKEIFDALAAITGIPSPRVKLPHWLPMLVAGASEAVAKITKKAPRVSLDSVRMSRHTMFFDASKAVRELGLPQTPVEQALGRAVAWFREHGYAPVPHEGEA
jgi:dihydroflavonol-4-reductase